MKIAHYIAFVFTLIISQHAFGQVINENPERLQKIDVVDKLGKTIPTDLEFVDESGKQVSLSAYFNDGKPVVLTFVYFRCPMLCTYVLNALADSLNQLPNYVPGKDYHLVTVSINPEEGPEVAQAKKENYLGLFDNPEWADKAIEWHFWTSPDNRVKELAENVGFQYYYDEEIGEYAHPAVVFLLTDQAKLSRNIYGMTYPIKDMRFGLLEASKGEIGNPLEKILLYCYRYDPDQGGYVLFARNAMKIAGLITIVFLAGFLGIMWKVDKSIDQNKGDKSA